MNIELRQLKHAVAVAEHASFGRAALELHLSQSALSRSIQALEREVGAPIFVRSTNGVQMTEVGRQLLQHAKTMLQVAAELDHRIVRNRSLQTGRLRVGLATATAEDAVTAAVEAMLQDHPMVALEVRTGLRTDLLPALRGGELDLLVADSTALEGRDPDFEMRWFEENPLVVVVRAGHPLAGQTTGRLRAAFAYPLVAPGRLRPELLSSVLEEQSRVPDAGRRPGALPAVITNSQALAERLVLHSDAVAAFAPGRVAGRVEAGELVPLAAPAWLTSPVGAAWMRQRSLDDTGQAFGRHLAEAQSRLAARDRQLIRQWLHPKD